ncbi:MAG: DnaD domain protein [Chloroflexi bacterium]|nr:DnaD domain protein [Chloroflexota bacterium]
MTEFAGFPNNARVTPLPNAFFTELLPFIDDPLELKVTLFLFNRLAWKRGFPRFVAERELAADLDVMSSMAKHEMEPRVALREGLQKAVKRGTFLALEVERPDGSERVYLLNDEAGKRGVEAVRRGQADLGGLPKVEPTAAPMERRSIFALYEENIGILSPMIAEELKEAEGLYPQEWVIEAFREAARLNKRSWRYIQRILERWKAEGRVSGNVARHPEAVPGERGRGGYIVRRKE